MKLSALTDNKIRLDPPTPPPPCSNRIVPKDVLVGLNKLYTLICHLRKYVPGYGKPQGGGGGQPLFRNFVTLRCS